jgi:signal transduction histidine kinase
MFNKARLLHILYILGLIAMIIGVLDPLEGSIIIAVGSALVAISTFLSHDRHQKIFLIAAISIVFGVFFLFYCSSLGGFGGNSKLSWWWGLLILPYPIGWLLTIIIVIKRAMTKSKL